MAEEGFHDYTLATKLERLVAQLEQCFRGWLLTGLENISHLPPALGADKQPINLVRVSSNIDHRMPWRAQPYILTLHVPYTREADLQAARQRQQQQQQQLQVLRQQQASIEHSVQPAEISEKQQQQQQGKAVSAFPGKGQKQSAAAALPAAAVQVPVTDSATAPADDQAAAAAAASKVLAQHGINAAAAGEGSDAMQKLHAELAPLLGAGNGADNRDGSAAGNGQQQQLQHQVEELIQQYRQLHMQLQEDAAQQQQQQQQGEDGSDEGAGAKEQSVSSDDAGTAAEAAGQSAAAAAAEDGPLVEGARESSSGGSNTTNGDSNAVRERAESGTGSAAGAAEESAGSRAGTIAAAVKGGKKLHARKLRASATGDDAQQQQQQQQQLRGLSIGDRKASSSAGAAAAVLKGDQREGGSAAAAATAAAEESPDDEATSRQVELPAPELLTDANSRALAAVKAAVQQDHSRTAASRTWWPFCFDTATIQQQLQLLQQHQHQQMVSMLAAGQSAVASQAVAPLAVAPHALLQLQGSSGMPSIGSPWWSPGSGANKLQRWFGVDLFVLLQPASYSRRFLDAAESSSMLSVARLALSSAGVCWPLLLPVHDALRDAYIGVAQVSGLSVLFHTDSIHISRLPRHLSAPEQQLSLLADQLTPHNPAAAAACLAVLGQHTDSTAAAAVAGHSSRSTSPMWVAPGAKQQQQGGQGVAGCTGQYGVWMSACFTYRLPDASRRFHLQHLLSSGNSIQHSTYQQQQVLASHHLVYPQQQQQQQQEAESAGFSHEDDESDFLDWDADSAWHPWAQHRDPIQTLELDVIWRDTQLTADCGTAGAQSGTDGTVASSSGWGVFRADTAAGSCTDTVADSSSSSSSKAPAAAAAAAAGGRQALSPAGMSALVSDPSSADVWVLHVLQHGYSSAPARSGRLGVKGYERHRRHVRVEAAGADWLWSAAAAHEVLTLGGRLSGVCPQPWGFNHTLNPLGAQLDPGAFTTMLSALMTARTAAAAADSLWELTGADWWESRGEPSAPPIPPDSVFDSVLRDLLSPPRPAGAAAAAAGSGSGTLGCTLSSRSSRDLTAPSGALSRCSSGVGLPAAAPAAAGNGQFACSATSACAEPSAAAAAAAIGDSMLPRSAPPGSLLCRLALHALVFGNARAVAALWQRFVIQARLQFWEQRTLLPYLPAGQHSSSSSSGSIDSSSSGTSAAAAAAAAGPPGGPPAPDLNSCLIHQKLQMLNMCIWRRDRRLGRGWSGKLQQQQQQQRLRGRHLGSNGSSSGSSDGDADSSAVAAAGRSSSRLSGLATAASSTFYSVTGDETEQDVDFSAAAEGEGGSVHINEGGEQFLNVAGDAPEVDWADDTDGVAAAAAAAEGVGLPQQQQRRRQELLEDANSEFYSVAGSMLLNGSTNSTTAAAAAADGDDDATSAAAAAAASDPDAEPQGVAAVVPGQFLLLYPDRPLRVPVVQDDPVFTEDQMVQRQTALLQLAAATAEDNSSSKAGRQGGGVSSGAAELLLLKQRLLAAPLLSDMCAFKAANPGCCFEDFLRWYLPKDWQQQVDQQQQQQSSAQQQQQQQEQEGDVQSLVNPTRSSSQASCPTPSPEPSTGGTTAAAAAADAVHAAAAGGSGQLSARMGCADPGNDWQQLWLLAEPQPAAAQRPLLNPQKEGELVLHYLETVSPLALFSQLLSAAVCEALDLLAASRGAALPAAAAVVDRFRSMASGVLRKGGGLAEPLAAAAAVAGGSAGREQQQQQHELAGDWQGAEDGLSDVELELLLAEFSYVEQVVVLGESLLHHLPGQPHLASRLLTHLLHGADSNSTPEQQQQRQQQRQQQHQQQQGVESSATSPPPAAAAAAEEVAVLGAGSRLPVASLSLQERHALMRWVAECTPTDPAAKLQRDVSHIGSQQHPHSPQQQQQQDGDGWEGGGWGHRSSCRSSSRQQYRGSRDGSTPASPVGSGQGSHLMGLTSPRGDWAPDETPTAAAAAAAASPQSLPGDALQQQQQQQQQHEGECGTHLLQELRRLQHALGQPAQQEWVTTCGPIPQMPSGVDSDPSTSSSSSTTVPLDRTSGGSQQRGTAGGSAPANGTRRMRPAVAAAVAAACGSSNVAAAGGVVVAGLSGPTAPVPPSRLYIQEADGEMRLATVSVSQQGL